LIHIRRVPFVENGEIVGLCAKGDLAKVNIHVNEAGEASSLSVPYEWPIRIDYANGPIYIGEQDLYEEEENED